MTKNKKISILGIIMMLGICLSGYLFLTKNPSVKAESTSQYSLNADW